MVSIRNDYYERFNNFTDSRAYKSRQGKLEKNAERIGQKYYDGEHDILQYRVFYYNADGELVEDRYCSNERISHPFFTELVDQLTSYILSDEEENIITSDEE